MGKKKKKSKKKNSVETKMERAEESVQNKIM